MQSCSAGWRSSRDPSAEGALSAWGRPALGECGELCFCSDGCGLPWQPALAAQPGSSVLALARLGPRAECLEPGGQWLGVGSGAALVRCGTALDACAAALPRVESAQVPARWGVAPGHAGSGPARWWTLPPTPEWSAGPGDRPAGSALDGGGGLGAGGPGGRAGAVGPAAFAGPGAALVKPSAGGAGAPPRPSPGG